MVEFLFTSIVMGVGLALDSAVVSMTNGLTEPNMNYKRNFLISLNFGLFQGFMPLIGYFISSAFIEYFENYIPWIALVLLSFLGTKSIVETIREKRKKSKNNFKNSEITINNEEKTENLQLKSEKIDKIGTPTKVENIKKLKFTEIIVQGVATSIDALCVGIVIANYTRLEAFVCVGIIAVITFVLSFISTNIGKKFGYKFESSAELISGIILILVGIEICITGLVG